MTESIETTGEDSVIKQEETVVTRDKILSITNLITVTAILYWLLIMAYAHFAMLPRPQYTILYIGGGMFIYLFTQMEDSPSKLQWGLLIVLLAVAVAATVYFTIYFTELYYERSITVYTHEVVLAVFLSLVIAYLAYREFGLAFFGVAAGTAIYAYFGPYFPGLLAHGGLSFSRIMDTLVLDIRGFYGSISRIVAAWVALFLLYAGLLRGYGAFDLILRAAFRASNLVSSGIAQSAVVASMIIGSINGSQTANSAMTGSFTIPLMKESGLPGRTAAAIESVASTGGQIMPPVMGAAAFVMASLLGITYIEVLIAGLLPAAIFYISVTISVHYASMRGADELMIDPAEHIEAKSRRALTIEGIMFGLPFIALIYMLGIAQWTVMRAALLTCLLMIITGTLIPILRSLFDIEEERNVKTVGIDGFWNTVAGFRYGAVIMAPIVIIVAIINGIVDLLMGTGMPGTFALGLMELSGGVLFIATIAAMIICIILGLGMPTVAAYTLVAILVAPTFVNEFLLPELSAHYFVFYAAILSGITPPIAVAVVVTAGIAESDFWQTGFEAMRIAATLFILPLVFIYNPEIVVGGFTFQSILSAGIVLLGGISVSHGLNYVNRYGTKRVLDYSRRGLFIALGAFAMVYPGFSMRISALVIIAILMLFQRQTEFIPKIRDRV